MSKFQQVQSIVIKPNTKNKLMFDSEEVPAIPSVKGNDWQPEQAKHDVHETIHSSDSMQSRQSVPSPRDPENIIQDQDESGDVAPVMQASHYNRQVESLPSNRHNQKPHYEEDGNNTLLEIQQAINDNEKQNPNNISYQNNSNIQSFHPNLHQSQNQSNDQVSNASYIKEKKKAKIYSFYYDKIGDQESIIVPSELSTRFIRNFLEQTILPLLFALLVFVANYLIQQSVQDFCYIKDICACSNYNIRFWSFVRQMIMLKLSMIVYRRHVLCKVAMGSSNSNRKNPFIESFILISFAVGLDFILVIWIKNNQDWVFLILIYIITIPILLGTFRMRDWVRVFYKGRALIFYDAIYICLLMYIFYIIPNIIFEFQRHYNDVVRGVNDFIFVYPFIDVTFEILLDYFLGSLQLGELFIYQSQLILIGLRLGILCLVGASTVEFWYLLIFLGLLRANNSSMFLTVFLRRIFYYLSPSCMRGWTSMEETSRIVKGKHGAYLEHQFWPIFFYFFYLTGHSVPYYVKDETLILDCKFNNPTFGLLNRGYQPLIVWIGLLAAEGLGALLNRIKNYDNIKWLGGTGFNIVENTFIRITGYYFFQIAFMVPFHVKSLNDINNHQLNVQQQASLNYETL